MAVVHRFTGSGSQYKWEDVKPEIYGATDISGVLKHVLIGSVEGAPNFVIRYFQVEPGGYSRLESHPHEHGVVILQGSAKVQLNDRLLTLGPLDVIFIAGNDKHQLTNVGEGPLGFICVIPPNI